MKKIKKSDLRLEKEVISALTENDLESMRGGTNTKDSNVCIEFVSDKNSCMKTKCYQTECCASFAIPGEANPCQTNQNCLQSNGCMTNPKCQNTFFCPYTKDTNTICGSI